jgi:hypothetical protein
MIRSSSDVRTTHSSKPVLRCYDCDADNNTPASSFRHSERKQWCQCPNCGDEWRDPR